jgi:hypothetical protein
MIGRWARLGRSGSMVAEFAFVVPVLLSLVFGLIQAGVLFVANAGLKHGVGEAARMATLWPVRSDAELTAELNAKVFGLNPARLSAPVITRGEAQGSAYAEISATYTVPMDLFVISLQPVVLRESRRVYIP